MAECPEVGTVIQGYTVEEKLQICAVGLWRFWRLLRSTDSQVLDRIPAELKKVITDFRVSADSKFPSGEMYYFHIDKLQGKDRQVGWWLLKQLCLQGWETFAVQIDTRVGWHVYYHLRLEGNAK